MRIVDIKKAAALLLVHAKTPHHEVISISSNVRKVISANIVGTVTVVHYPVRAMRVLTRHMPTLARNRVVGTPASFVVIETVADRRQAPVQKVRTNTTNICDVGKCFRRILREE